MVFPVTLKFACASIFSRLNFRYIQKTLFYNLLSVKNVMSQADFSLKYVTAYFINNQNKPRWHFSSLSGPLGFDHISSTSLVFVLTMVYFMGHLGCFLSLQLSGKGKEKRAHNLKVTGDILFRGINERLTIAWEAASQIALRNHFKDVREEREYIGVFVGGIKNM